MSMFQNLPAAQHVRRQCTHKLHILFSKQIVVSDRQGTYTVRGFAACARRRVQDKASF